MYENFILEFIRAKGQEGNGSAERLHAIVGDRMLLSPCLFPVIYHWVSPPCSPGPMSQNIEGTWYIILHRFVQVAYRRQKIAIFQFGIMTDERYNLLYVVTYIIIIFVIFTIRIIIIIGHSHPESGRRSETLGNFGNLLKFQSNLQLLISNCYSPRLSYWIHPY